MMQKLQLTATELLDMLLVDLTALQLMIPGNKKNMDKHAVIQTMRFRVERLKELLALAGKAE